MINTEGTGITSEQLIILERCYEEGTEEYKNDLKSEKDEFKGALVLGSLLPITLIFFLIGDMYINDTQVDIMGIFNTLLFVFIPTGFLFLLIWGSTRKLNSTLKNQEGIVKILEKFKSLATNSDVTNTTDSDFYSTAHKQKILNGIPYKINTDTKDSEQFVLESSNIYTTALVGRYSQVVDDCMLGRITYSNGLIPFSFSVQRDSTNSIIIILRQLLSSIGWGLVACLLYYFFIVEQCDYNAFDGGCDNNINLFGFFSYKYISYTLIIGIIFFAFGYVKTLAKKKNTDKISFNDEFDIFIHKGKISDIPKGYLEELRIFFKNYSGISNTFKFFADENYMYIRINRDIVSHKNNFISFILKTVVSGLSRKYSETEYVKKYVEYINFMNSIENLGNKLKNYY